MTLMTRKMVEQGRSSTGGFSKAQFTLVGINTDSPLEMAKEFYVPHKWWLNVIGRDYPDEVIAEFIALKDKHFTPTYLAQQFKRKVKLAQRKAASRAARSAPPPLPDGMWDVESSGRRELWENGERLKWYVKRNVPDWGAYPDPSKPRSGSGAA